MWTALQKISTAAAELESANKSNTELSIKLTKSETLQEASVSALKKLENQLLRHERKADEKDEQIAALQNSLNKKLAEYLSESIQVAD